MTLGAYQLHGLEHTRVPHGYTVELREVGSLPQMKNPPIQLLFHLPIISMSYQKNEVKIHLLIFWCWIGGLLEMYSKNTYISDKARILCYDLR